MKVLLYSLILFLHLMIEKLNSRFRDEERAEEVAQGRHLSVRMLAYPSES